MLTLDGFRQDIENIFIQLSNFISQSKILSFSSIRKPAVKKETTVKATRKTPPKSRAKRKSNKSRTRPLPPVGTKLKGRYKGVDYWGDVTKNGIVIEGIEGTFLSMSGAATAVTNGKTVNGWDFWKQIRI